MRNRKGTSKRSDPIPDLPTIKECADTVRNLRLCDAPEVKTDRNTRILRRVVATGSPTHDALLVGFLMLVRDWPTEVLSEALITLVGKQLKADEDEP